MLAGSVRVASIDPEGRNFIDDVSVGDTWNFTTDPIQFRASPKAANFCSSSTTAIFPKTEDYFFAERSVPRISSATSSARILSMPESAFANLPQDLEHTRWIFAGEVPGRLVRIPLRRQRGRRRSPTRTACRRLSRSRRKAARSASGIQRPSRLHRSPAPWSRSGRPRRPARTSLAQQQR